MPPKRRETEREKKWRDERARENEENRVKMAKPVDPLQAAIWRANRRISQGGRLV